MFHHHRQSFAASLLLAGLLLSLMSFGGTWGTAYGQTAGPTPGPTPAILSVTKEVDNTSPRPGDTVTFTIRVTNTGGQPARAVKIVDAMPDAFEVIDVTTTQGTASANGQTIMLDVPELAPGTTVVITIRARVRAFARGQITNNVVVRAIDSNGANLAEGRASTVLAVEAEAGEDTGVGHGAAGNPGQQAQQGDDGVRDQLSNTGASSEFYWPLLLLGLLLMSAGGLIFRRARSTNA